MYFVITIIDGRIELQIPYNWSDIQQLKFNGWKFHGLEGRNVWSFAGWPRIRSESTELLRN